MNNQNIPQEGMNERDYVAEARRDLYGQPSEGSVRKSLSRFAQTPSGRVITGGAIGLSLGLIAGVPILGGLAGAYMGSVGVGRGIENIAKGAYSVIRNVGSFAFEKAFDAYSLRMEAEQRSQLLNILRKEQEKRANAHQANTGASEKRTPWDTRNEEEARFSPAYENMGNNKTNPLLMIPEKCPERKTEGYAFLKPSPEIKEKDGRTNRDYAQAISPANQIKQDYTYPQTEIKYDVSSIPKKETKRARKPKKSSSKKYIRTILVS